MFRFASKRIFSLNPIGVKTNHVKFLRTSQPLLTPCPPSGPSPPGPASPHVIQNSKKCNTLLNMLRVNNFHSKYDNNFKTIDEYIEDKNKWYYDNYDIRHDRYQCHVNSILYDSLVTYDKEIDGWIKDLITEQLYDKHYKHRMEELEKTKNKVDSCIDSIKKEIEKCKYSIMEESININKDIKKSEKAKHEYNKAVLEEKLDELTGNLNVCQEDSLLLFQIIQKQKEKPKDLDNELFWNSFAFEERFKSSNYW